MNFETAKSCLDNFFENRPTKDVFETCLLELITEKTKIVMEKDYDKILVEKIDKAIEAIQIYLSVASR